MNGSWASSEYVSGSYLHRLYLGRNALFSSIHSSADKTATKIQLEEKYKQLQNAENQILSAFAIQFSNGENSSPEKGFEIINNLLAGSDRALGQIIKQISPLLVKGEKFDLSVQENRDRITDTIVNYLLGQKEDFSKGIEQKLVGLYESAYDRVIKEIGQIATSGKMRNGGSIYAYEGFLFEPLVNLIYTYNVLSTISGLNENKKMAFMGWAKEVAVISSLTGDEQWSAKSGDISTSKSRFSTHDMIIKVKMDKGMAELPIQLKAKPRSKEPVIQLTQRMEIENLIEGQTSSVSKAAIKTALINQHFWGTKIYKDLVEETGKLKNYTPDANLRSAHPTALERFDKSQTLEALQPIIPVLENAVFGKLVSGISDKIDTLLWVVAAPTGYKIMRSSDLLLSMMGAGEKTQASKKGDVKIKGLEGIKSSGKVKYQIKEGQSANIVDPSIEDLYGVPGRAALSRADWYAKTKGIVDSAYSKMGITLSFNYSGVK